jgi:superfamily II DNA or RNA helicase
MQRNVEAVTGAGKTKLGLAAIEEHLSAGGKTAVAVPSIELLRQWAALLEEEFPTTSVGLLGDGHHESLESCDILVATAASARQYDLGLELGEAGLLVADECHTYGAQQSRLALETEFERRLGLSATYARADGEHEVVLEPYFDGVVFTLNYREAIDEGVVARFKVGLVPVAFRRDERREYDELSEQVRRARTHLVLEFDLPAEPFGEFIRLANQLRKTGDRRESMAAGRYLYAFNRRRALLAETEAKYGGLERLAPAVEDSDRSIVFTQTIASAMRAAATLTERSVGSAAIHSKLSRDERSTVLRRFAEGGLKAIVAPKVLDEGIDVPAADLAVIVAASHQRRQMIQRMGRVLRRKPDGRRARFAILFVEGTSEDPDRGAHEAFLDEILPVADEVHQFEAGASAPDLAEFLRPD